MSTFARTTCELCGGEYAIGRSACPHCGNKGSVEVNTVDHSKADPSALPEIYQQATLATLGLFILLLLVYIAPMHALHGPVWRLVKLYLGTSLLLAVLSMKDAQALARAFPMRQIRPELLFVHQLLAWPAMLPLYNRFRDEVTGQSRKLPTMLPIWAAALALLILLFAFLKERRYHPPALEKHVTPELHEHWPPHHEGERAHAHTPAPVGPSGRPATPIDSGAAAPAPPAKPQPTPFGRNYHVAPNGTLHRM